MTDRHLSVVPDSPPPGPLAPKRPLGLPERFSYSAASTFEDCPRKWQAKYLWGCEDPAGPPAIAGSIAHSILQHYIALPRWARTGPAFRLAVAAALATAESEDGPVDRATARLGVSYAARALTMPEVATAEVWAVEQRTELTIGGVPFIGFTDKLVRLPSDGASVRDYKTGKRPGKREWGESPRRQVRLYTVANQKMGVPAVEAAIVWIQDRIVEPVSVSDVELGTAVGWLRRLWGELTEFVRLGASDEASGDGPYLFPADPGPLCSWCPGLRWCPEGQEAVLERSQIKGKSIGEHGAAWLASRTD